MMSDDVTVMLDERFMKQIDVLAAKRGLQAPTTTWPNGDGARKKSARAPPAKWRRR